MLHRVSQGIRWGVGLGVILSAWAAFLAVLSGSTDLHGKGGDVISLWWIIAIYLLGGAIVGALIGVTMPLFRWRVVAGLVGCVSAMILGAGVITGLSTFDAWSRTERVALPLFGIAFGIPGGLIVRGFLIPYLPKPIGKQRRKA